MLQLKNKTIIHNYTDMDNIEALLCVEIAEQSIKQDKIKGNDIRIQLDKNTMVSRDIKGSTKTFKIYRIGGGINYGR